MTGELETEDSSIMKMVKAIAIAALWAAGVTTIL
jgi:hypothetical protein